MPTPNTQNNKTSHTSQTLSHKNFLGFTLIELIVVITILVILGTIAFLNLGGFQSSARDGRRVSDMANIGKAIDLAIIQQGSAPIPTSAVSYTGGSVTLSIGTVTSTTVPRMNGDFSDPLTRSPYNYSVFGNGLYYQIGIDFENPIAFTPSPSRRGLGGGEKGEERGWGGGGEWGGLGGGLIDTVYAADSSLRYSKLSGNYVFDPSLPSLFVLSGSYNTASGGIFAPDVCFVLDNVSTNTFGSSVSSVTSSGCIAKKDMSLNTLDRSLVGYWDMETYYQATYSGTNNVVFLKDLSGNNYDMIGKRSASTFLTGTTTISGSIFMSGGMRFDRSNFLYSFFSSPTNITLGGRSISYVTPDFYKKNENPSGVLKDGISISTLISYDKAISETAYDKMLFSYTRNNSGSVDPGDTSKYDMLLHRMLYDGTPGSHYLPHAFHTYFSQSNSYLANTYYLSGAAIGCSANGSALGECYIINRSYSSGGGVLQNNMLRDGNMLLLAIFDFNNKIINYYINGTKITSTQISKEAMDKILEPGFKNGNFGIGGYLHSNGTITFNPPFGTIQDIKIYSRALSDSEIKQQARIAGF
ncbi:MAG: type II secretion system protein [Candidatus Gracilibacteria bacterium]|nr:type II secretion system protein [Candidatus Gracilibacteria bacterium]